MNTKINITTTSKAGKFIVADLWRSCGDIWRALPGEYPHHVYQTEEASTYMFDALNARGKGLYAYECSEYVAHVPGLESDDGQVGVIPFEHWSERIHNDPDWYKDKVVFIDAETLDITVEDGYLVISDNARNRGEIVRIALTKTNNK